MTDLTPILNPLIQAHNGTPVGQAMYSFDTINTFLREAYQINRGVADLLGRLRSIRQPYLSGAQPPRRKLGTRSNAAKDSVYLTDKDRDQIDAEAKTILRDLHAAVNQLSKAEQVRQETQTAVAEKRRRKNGFGVLGQWAAGGAIQQKSPEEQAEEERSNGVKAHREGVIWFLQRRLEHCGMLQSSMMQIRVDREIEKNKSILSKSSGARAMLPPAADVVGSSTTAKRATKSSILAYEMEAAGVHAPVLDPEQLQMFEKENQDMLKYYESKLDQVRTAEKSIVEISELQSTLATNLAIQDVHIKQLVQDSYNTTDNVETGNKELKKASERKSTAKMVFLATLGTCTVLVLLDLVT